MQKRLKEIVIYILENSSGLEPEQRAELEELREKLNLSGFPVAEIERAIRRVLETGKDPDTLQALGNYFGAEIQEIELAADANDYLRRLVESGLISQEQEDEIIARAARYYPQGVGLSEIQFLAASLIFDENLGAIVGGEWGDELNEARRQH